MSTKCEHCGNTFERREDVFDAGLSVYYADIHPACIEDGKLILHGAEGCEFVKAVCNKCKKEVSIDFGNLVEEFEG